MTEDSIVEVLRNIYEATLERCEPGALLRKAIADGRVIIPDDVASIVSLGKCAVPLARAAAELTGITKGLVVYPEGYGTQSSLPASFESVVGSHPIPSEQSVRAARRAIDFVTEQQAPILFLVSGGASACMEDGLAPHVTLEQLMEVNSALLKSGLPIESINTVRRHLSSVKGGRLGALAPKGSVTLVYSDVPPGYPELVGSGPTANDPTTLAEAAAILRGLGIEWCEQLARDMESGMIPETLKIPPTSLSVIGDSDAMIDAAVDEGRRLGLQARQGPSLDGDVEDVARRLARASEGLAEGEVLVSAGESTVRVRGDGVGGRCTELGARFTLATDEAGQHECAALFGSSDGRDGSSPAAAVLVRPLSSARLSGARAAEALARSASYELITDYGEPIMMMPTGNNLRDIALVLRQRRI